MEARIMNNRLINIDRVLPKQKNSSPKRSQGGQVRQSPHIDAREPIKPSRVMVQKQNVTCILEGFNWNSISVKRKINQFSVYSMNTSLNTIPSD